MSFSSSKHSKDLPAMENDEFGDLMILSTVNQVPKNNEEETESRSLPQLYGNKRKNGREITPKLGKAKKKECSSWQSSLKTDKDLRIIGQSSPRRRQRRNKQQMAEQVSINEEIRKYQNNEATKKGQLLNKEHLVNLAKKVLESMRTLGDWTEEEQKMEMIRMGIQDQNNQEDNFENRFQEIITIDDLQKEQRLRSEMQSFDFHYFSLMLRDNPAMAEQSIDQNESVAEGTGASRKTRAFKCAIQSEILYEERRLGLENLRKTAYEKEMGDIRRMTGRQLPIHLHDGKVTKAELEELARCALKLNMELNGGRQNGGTLWDGATALTHEKLELAQRYNGNIQFENEAVHRAKTLFNELIPSNPYTRRTISDFLKFLEKRLYERNEGWYRELSEISLQKGDNLRNKGPGTQNSSKFREHLQAKLIWYIAQLEIALHMQVEAERACDRTVQERQCEQEKRKEVVKKPNDNNECSGNFGGRPEDFFSESRVQLGEMREKPPERKKHVVMAWEEYEKQSGSTQTTQTQPESSRIRNPQVDHSFHHQQADAEPGQLPSTTQICYQFPQEPQADSQLYTLQTDHQFSENQEPYQTCQLQSQQLVSFHIAQVNSLLHCQESPGMQPSHGSFSTPLPDQHDPNGFSNSSDFPLLNDSDEFEEGQNINNFGGDDVMDWDCGPEVQVLPIEPKLTKPTSNNEIDVPSCESLLEQNGQRSNGVLNYYNSYVAPFGTSEYKSKEDLRRQIRENARREALYSEPEHGYLKLLKDEFIKEMARECPGDHHYMFDQFIFWLQDLKKKNAPVPLLEPAICLAEIEFKCRWEEKVQDALKNLELQKFVIQKFPER